MTFNRNLFAVVGVSFLLVLFSSCSQNNSGESTGDESTAIARVGDTYLYEDDLIDIIPKGISSKDSLSMLKRYAENWINDRLLIQKAEENLTEEQKDVEKQLQDYKHSLITYIYLKELIGQYLDTTVTNAEIEKYYKEHESDFALKDNIIKVIYVKIKNNAPKLDVIKRLYKSSNLKDREQLATYCYQYAENFYLNDETWLFFDDLLKEVPITTYNKDLYLQNNRYVEVADSQFVYLLNIKGFKIAESTSPLSFEENNIKNIILNKRKVNLVSKMKIDIYNDALNKNKAEIYINESQSKK